MTLLKSGISYWFDQGKQQGHAYMMIVCDTWDYEDYPVYVAKEDFWEQYELYNGKNMQRIVEIYNLSADKQKQLSESHAWHLPKPPSKDLAKGRKQ